jgi:diguanylate cyclase (GGDEF)-like protein
MAGKNRVLLVAADAALSKQATDVLSAAGYEVSSLAQGLDVAKVLEDDPPDLILMSHQLPDVHGLELCQRIRLYVDTFLPVIVMLPNPTPDAKVAAFDSGADDCLGVPFDSRELVARTRSMIRLKNAIDSLYKSREDLDEARERLERLVVLDGLTDLFNHRHMHEILDDEIERARRYSVPLSVIMFDLDKFSEVNDRHGHQCGDMVLRDVAAVMSGNCRSTDRVCRYGGDEMLIICPHTEMVHAAQLAQRLRHALKAATFFSEKGQIKVTGSFGVSTLSDAGSKRDLLKQADEAHYAAKALGGNHVVEWSKKLGADPGARHAREPRKDAAQ